MNAELNALENVDIFAGQSFGQGKGIFSERELVECAVILVRAELVKVNSQRTRKVKKPNHNIRHFIFDGVFHHFGESCVEVGGGFDFII